MSRLYFGVESNDIKRIDALPDNIFDKFQDKVSNAISKYLYCINLCESPIEKLLMLELADMHLYCFGVDNNRKDSLRIIPQKEIKILDAKYRVDFMFEYHSKNKDKVVIVECDGHDFHEKTKQQAAKDKKRDRDLIKEGYIVLHFTGSEIYKDPKLCVIEILKSLGIKAE